MVNPRAFTLIELLVVIGILALLTGILLPALSPAAAASRRTACLSNLRQMGFSAQQYREDHGGQLPLVQSMPVDPTRPNIMDAFKSFIADDAVWRCPSDDQTAKQYGTSYEYFLGFFLQLMDDAQRKELFAATRDDGGRSVAVLQDAEGWHPGGPDSLDRNALYLDGHVDWLIASERN